MFALDPFDDTVRASSIQGSCIYYLKSPSDEEAKIHVSPGFLPKREPSGSLSMTYLMAWPTRPVPPVTRMTEDMVDREQDRSFCRRPLRQG